MKIGFIGNGNMANAILNGILQNNIAAPQDIIISDINTDGLYNTQEKYGVTTTTNNKEVASNADLLFLAIKPNVLYNVIEEIKKPIKLVRVMPNTPAFVGEAMSGISLNTNVTDIEKDAVLSIFNSIGKAQCIPEKLMDTVTGISGSSPAYVFMFIEAMADAAVKGGMPRDIAYTFCAQAVLGSAKMVLETGIHPAKLKDMVCSPGGTTISAVETLESTGFRGSVMSAVKACIEKSKNM